MSRETHIHTHKQVPTRAYAIATMLIRLARCCSLSLTMTKLCLAPSAGESALLRLLDGRTGGLRASERVAVEFGSGLLRAPAARRRATCSSWAAARICAMRSPALRVAGRCAFGGAREACSHPRPSMGTRSSPDPGGAPNAWMKAVAEGAAGPEAGAAAAAAAVDGAVEGRAAGREGGGAGFDAPVGAGAGVVAGTAVAGRTSWLDSGGGGAAAAAAVAGRDGIGRLLVYEKLAAGAGTAAEGGAALPARAAAKVERGPGAPAFADEAAEEAGAGVAGLPAEAAEAAAMAVQGEDEAGRGVADGV